jgi:sec-independent protein translocase protein TatA
MIPPSELIHLMFGVGPPELLIIFLIIIVLFGASRIPKLARGLGKGITEFKKGLKETGSDDDDESVKEIEDDTQKNKKDD